MGLGKDLIKLTAKLADLYFDDNLSAIKNKVRKHGYNLTFEGEYIQAPKGQPQIEIRVPFVVAQSDNQRAQLFTGVLEGRVYDHDFYALIHGKIDRNFVRFGKLYQESSVENPEKFREEIEKIRKIFELVGEPSKVKSPHLVNPHVIVYEGERIKGIDKLVYFGRWGFNSDESDMETQGEFIMRLTDPNTIKITT